MKDFDIVLAYYNFAEINCRHFYIKTCRLTKYEKSTKLIVVGKSDDQVRRHFTETNLMSKTIQLNFTYTRVLGF